MNIHIRIFLRNFDESVLDVKKMSENTLGEKLIDQFEEKIVLLEWRKDAILEFKREHPETAKDESTRLLDSIQKDLEYFSHMRNGLVDVLSAKTHP